MAEPQGHCGRAARALDGADQKGAKERLVGQRRDQKQLNRLGQLRPGPWRRYPVDAEQLRCKSDGNSKPKGERDARAGPAEVCDLEKGAAVDAGWVGSQTGPLLRRKANGCLQRHKGDEAEQAVDCALCLETGSLCDGDCGCVEQHKGDAAEACIDPCWRHLEEVRGCGSRRRK